jgi:hypothetical protein
LRVRVEARAAGDDQAAQPVEAGGGLGAGGALGGGLGGLGGLGPFGGLGALGGVAAGLLAQGREGGGAGGGLEGRGRGGGADGRAGEGAGGGGHCGVCGVEVPLIEESSMGRRERKEKKKVEMWRGCVNQPRGGRWNHGANRANKQTSSSLPRKLERCESSAGLSLATRIIPINNCINPITLYHPYYIPIIIPIIITIIPIIPIPPSSSLPSPQHPRLRLRRPNPVRAVSAIPEFLSAYQATAAPQFRLPFLLQSPTILTILAALANQKPRIGHFVLGGDRLVNYDLGLPRGMGMRNDAGLRGIARVGWGVTWREREEGEGEQ